MDFVLPEIIDNDSWGPSGSHLPGAFKDIPYAHYNKSDKIDRIAEWYDAPSSTSNPSRSNANRSSSNRRDQQPAGGPSTNNAFGYVHDEDEKSFSLVDNKSGAGVKPRGGVGLSRGGRGGASGGASRGGANAGQRNGAGAGGNARGGQRGGAQRGGGQRGGGRGGWNSWNQNTRTRESSVAINPEWSMLEEIEFARLAKLSLTVEDPETLSSYGTIYAYEKSYDRINTKTSLPLQTIDRTRYNPTTSDDPVIQELASKDSATVFATDAILSLLMCAPRSVNSWDIVMVREGDKLFLDKREGSAFDYITVNENASDPPPEVSETDASNSAPALSLEATFVNSNFACQVVSEAEASTKKASRVNLGNPNPFYSPGEETDPLASCGYRYRKFNLSTPSEGSDGVTMVVRTEVDSVIKSVEKGGEDTFVTVKTLLNGPTGASSGGVPAVDWKQKLDTQRGAVAAMEMKNNSAKLARWAVQSILAGAEVMKMGYIARSTPKDHTRHVILGTQSYKPKDFAAQMNVSVSNGWGIVRNIIDLCMKQPEGRYVLVKDPNKAIIRLYSVPSDAFNPEGENNEEGSDAEAKSDEE
ncbi:eukaryotic translation initiation factor 3 subunit D [Mrakia frigida]|uniref:eukaryotic translation initiation factor 3 subunit D n=1 Tax=Mrakia frigida TaxID=29902 RepID=UPI003FCC0508